MSFVIRFFSGEFKNAVITVNLNSIFVFDKPWSNWFYILSVYESKICYVWKSFQFQSTKFKENLETICISI